MSINKKQLPNMSILSFSDLPSHKEIRLPALSPTMSTGTIISWEKEEGEEITDGDVLAQVETDKATMDMDSAMSGYMAKIVIPAGTKDIPLGKVSRCTWIEHSHVTSKHRACDIYTGRSTGLGVELL